MKKFFADFKAFLTRGNILDMAVGVIVGGSFNTIVTTLNKNVLMPIVNWALSYISGGQELCTVLPNYILYDPISHAASAPTVVNGVEYFQVFAINWSSLIESIINFFFVALTLFVILRVVVYMSKKRQELVEAIKKDNEEPTTETPQE